MIDAADEKRIVAAIAEAEGRTSAEIVVVLARRCGSYRLYPLAVASLAALTLPFLLIVTTALSAQRIALVQLAVFLGLHAVLSLPRVTRWITPASVLRRRAHAFALEQFWLRGVARTQDRVGVLVFCAIGERVARIIADDGVGARVTQADWEGAVRLIVAEAQRGRPVEGCVKAVEACGALLARDFPALPGDRDELANKVYLV